MRWTTRDCCIAGLQNTSKRKAYPAHFQLQLELALGLGWQAALLLGLATVGLTLEQGPLVARGVVAGGGHEGGFLQLGSFRGLRSRLCPQCALYAL